MASSISWEDLPLAEIVRRRVQTIMDKLGSHRVPDLYRRVMKEVERVLIEEALVRSGGCRQDAAQILGIHRNTLRARIRELGIHLEKQGR